jgi:hypothetical protein
MTLGACGDDESSNREEALEQRLVLDQQTQQVISNPRFIRAQGQGAPTEEPGGTDFPHTPDQVIELFRTADVPLVVTEEFAGGDTILDVEETETLGVFSKYGGPFRIFVVTSEASLNLVLSDAEGNRVEPDAEGIYWVLHEGEYEGESYRIWTASKPYDNVVSWWIGGENQETNEGWNELNALLDRLGGG